MTLPRPIFWLLNLSAFIVALVSWRVFLGPIEQVMPWMAAYLPNAPLGVWGHVALAPLALALSPFQLMAGLRVRHPALHRWAGRLYGLSVLGAGLAALALVSVSDASTFARAGFAVLAVLWIGTTALGIAAAWRQQFAAHRAWILRSVALTFAAVSLRVIMAPLMAAGWTVLETYDLTAWGSWILTLGLTEAWMRRGRMERS